MGQPLGVSWIGKAGEVEGMLVSGSGDDRVDLALQRELDCSLDRMACQPAGSYDTSSILAAVARPLAPTAHREAPANSQLGELVLRPDQREVRVQRLGQCAGDDLRTDASRIAQRNRQSRARAASS
jgi:hypothetical protein